ncbi:hypothetical protein GUITHDRAFT_102365 [Guillardia theta CCMP2712]|uniref:Uncharacterized protein n=1 Tax=Guillardia theta (strain CCMP2712) TaxID=905079 RepID=L1JUJ3_GUITC|nr:hypothetical protein GUITHDRAFT_102365 [Guillardia theta CCMP2712]EKX51758.1 hypothetical protein GUITHDRAFT_102365 [Guillardia theta CCMP2712]|eukprot:XP_005838738.1 hypothetical protein GUITHDRAFT_102365 [Guillardia theta CCMP2712]
MLTGASIFLDITAMSGIAPVSGQTFHLKLVCPLVMQLSALNAFAGAMTLLPLSGVKTAKGKGKAAKGAKAAAKSGPTSFYAGMQ